MIDVIGDIHGHAEELAQLLKQMGYESHKKGFRHPDKHKVYFVGDLIDRGKEQRRTLEMVRSMVDEGDAQVIMGNHEFNAICFATKLADGSYARAHNDKHTNQHNAFLAEFPFDSDDYWDQIAFFKSMPLWLELPELRIVHAQWVDKWIHDVKPFLDENNCINSDEVYAIYANKGKTNSAVYAALDGLLKGAEVNLDEWDISFLDADKNKRTDARIYWWRIGQDLQQVLNIPGESVDWTLLEPVSSKLTAFSYTNKKPVFFGHYWLKDVDYENKAENTSAYCLDFSVAKEGQLVGCRFAENTELAWFSVDSYY